MIISPPPTYSIGYQGLHSKEHTIFSPISVMGSQIGGLDPPGKSQVLKVSIGIYKMGIKTPPPPPHANPGKAWGPPLQNKLTKKQNIKKTSEILVSWVSRSTSS